MSGALVVLHFAICNYKFAICNLFPNWTHSHQRPNTKPPLYALVHTSGWSVRVRQFFPVALLPQPCSAPNSGQSQQHVRGEMRQPDGQAAVAISHRKLNSLVREGRERRQSTEESGHQEQPHRFGKSLRFGSDTQQEADQQRTRHVDEQCSGRSISRPSRLHHVADKEPNDRPDRATECDEEQFVHEVVVRFKQ